MENPIMDYVLLGRRIRNARKRRGLTREFLSEQVGISNSFLYHIENGSRKASIATIKSLCGALGISADFVLDIPMVPGTDQFMEYGREYARELLETAIKISYANGEGTDG